jgi:DNA invertase Pin-like site-specific DNA recombinase
MPPTVAAARRSITKRHGVTSSTTRVAAIAIHKVERLTRSSAYVARTIERLDTHDTSFVCMTQQLNTTSSMARMTLNVTLSYA